MSTAIFKIEYSREAANDVSDSANSINRKFLTALKVINMKQIEVAPSLKWEEVLQQIKSEDIVLTCDGHAVALLREFDDDDLYWYAREHDPKFLASIARAREQVAQGKTISHEELKRELGIE